MEENRRTLLLAHIVVAIVRCDVLLVQIAIRCHRVPGPGRVPGDSVHVIPVISGTRIVHHAIWVGVKSVNKVAVMQAGQLTYRTRSTQNLPAGVGDAATIETWLRGGGVIPVVWLFRS